MQQATSNKQQATSNTQHALASQRFSGLKGSSVGHRFNLFMTICFVMTSFLFVSSCTSDLNWNEIDKVEDQASISSLDESTLSAMPMGSGLDLIDLLGTACIPEDNSIPGCNDTTFVDTMVISDLSMYPNCNFTVVFEFYECEDLSGDFQDITVGDFQVLDHDCDSFSNDLGNYINGTISSDFVTDFDLEMWDTIEMRLIEREFTDTTRFNCDVGPGVGRHWNINFIRVSCYTLYYYVLPGPFPCENCAPEYNYIKTPCGSQCCERHTRVCRESDGTLRIETYDATSPFSIDCSDENFLAPTALIGDDFQILGDSCRIMCPNS